MTSATTSSLRACVAALMLLCSSITTAAPVVASINPTSGSRIGGYTLTITGSGFGATAADNLVIVGGALFPITSASTTEIQCTVPAGTGADKSVLVVAGGQAGSGPMFGYDPPAITGVSTSTGPTAGGTIVTLTGTSFGAPGGGQNVTIGGVPVSGLMVLAPDTQLGFSTPAGAGANLPIVVQVGGQSSSSAYTFSYQAPNITSVSPTYYPTSGGQMTISGLNLGIQGTVTVGGVACTATSWNHTQIRCDIPAGVGTGKSVVVTVGGQATTAASTIGYHSPYVMTASVSHGPAAGGTVVTLNGGNYGRPGDGQQVEFETATGWAAASDIVILTHNQLRCTSPAGVGAARGIRVTAGGQSGTKAAAFSYDPPSVTTVGTCSTAGGSITISGTNFGPSGSGQSVTIGGVSVPVTSADNTSIVCDVPAGTGGAKSVVVSVGGQNSAGAPAFSYQGPSVASVTPSGGTTAGGYMVGIVGANFGPTGSSVSVKIGGVDATGAAITTAHTGIDCIIPAGVGADQPVVVTVDGQSSSGGPLFAYNPPTISSVSPSWCSVAGGCLVEIAGTNFGPDGAGQTVSIGGMVAPIVSVGHTTVTCLMPAGSGGASDVVVDAGGQTASLARAIEYDPAWQTLVTESGDSPTDGFDETRIQVDYADGVTPAGGSVTTAILRHDSSDLQNIPSASRALCYWRVMTDRTFTSATVRVQYRAEEYPEVQEDQLVLLCGPSPSGPWTELTSQTRDTVANTVEGTASSLGYVVLTGTLVPVGLSRFSAE